MIQLPPDKWGEMTMWVDAYTVTLEANAEANSDPRVKQRIEGALREIKANLAAATNDEERKALGEAVHNQQAILDQLGHFDLEAFNDIRARWRQISSDLLRSGWDLRDKIDFRRKPDGDLHAKQGKTDIGITWSPATAAVAVTFFAFVNRSQNSIPDPRAYARQLLERQGITAENFDQHADRLAIQNPWKEPGRIILPGNNAP